MGESSNQFPPVYIRPPALQKLKAYIKYATGEISGLGVVTVDQDELLVEDLFTFEQVCHSTETELDREELSKAYTELIRQGYDVSHIRLWWH